MNGIAQKKDAIERCDEALEIAKRHGRTEGVHQKAWVIDQMCRALLGVEYAEWVSSQESGSNPEWDTGIAPMVESANTFPEANS